MENFKSFINKYSALIAIFLLIVACVFVFLINRNYEEAKFQKTITNQNSGAANAVREAANNNANSANFDIERRTEDVIRDKTITPKIIAARRKSQNSKTTLEKAKRKLNETNKNLHNANASRADNCVELQRLFPNEIFAYCH